jgi:hypothetical protein
MKRQLGHHQGDVGSKTTYEHVDHVNWTKTFNVRCRKQGPALEILLRGVRYVSFL